MTLDISLPKKYDLVVGDTFELFYSGIIKARSIDSFYICVECDIGQAFGRKFVATPTEDNIGDHRLTVTVSDNFGNAIGHGETVLKVGQRASTPDRPLNALIVGDSLTSGGVWADELGRRLTKSGRSGYGDESTPDSFGLGNIKFIGKKTSKKSGICYEGFGGWTFSSYLQTSNGGTAYWVSVDSHSKTLADQEALYRDENGTLWQLETIEEKRLLFKKHGEGTLLPTSGVLTHSGSGTDTSQIDYHCIELDSSNPFCYNGMVDFSAYCKELGVSTVDICYILLGWNNSLTPKDEYINTVKTFLDKLFDFNPDCRIVLMGIQMPSVDGMATSYGASAHWTLSNIQDYVFWINREYEALADEYSARGLHLDFINIAGQFDAEHCFPTLQKRVNTRVAVEETVQSNGVHPNDNGYLQIADAAFRHFNNILNKLK